METCKDCIHYDVCSLEEGEILIGAKKNGFCGKHKDKSRFIELPCKVGDTVYKIVNDKRVKKPYECKVIGFWYFEDETCNSIHLVHYVNEVLESSFSVPFIEIDKTVFLAREDAEKALLGYDNE